MKAKLVMSRSARNRPLASLPILLGFFVAGCISRQTFARCDLDCYVYDSVTHAAIPGAAVYLVFKGERGEIVSQGPFLADRDGLAHVAVEALVLKGPLGSKGGDTYYRRSIEVTIRGYVKTTIREHLPNYDQRNVASFLAGARLEDRGPFFCYLTREFPNQQSTEPTPASVAPVAGQPPRQT